MTFISFIVTAAKILTKSNIEKYYIDRQLELDNQPFLSQNHKIIKSSHHKHSFNTMLILKIFQMKHNEDVRKEFTKFLRCTKKRVIKT